MDKDSPNRRLLEFEISQCRGELTGLSHIIDEIEGEFDRFHNPTDQDSSQRSNQQPKNHDQAVAHYNRLMMKLHTLNCRAISHPIHRLPLELLEHIFHLLFSEVETYRTSWHEAFPLNLTQVCIQWESLVLSVRNRRLWSTVWIDPADPDWLERLHLYHFLSRDEGLNIHITEVTQSIMDELAGRHGGILFLPPGSVISQIWDSTTSEPDIVRVVITDIFRTKPLSIPLSSSMKALPFVQLGEGSLRRLQSFSQLQVLRIWTQAPQLLESGGPLQLPALQTLFVVTHENPLEFLRIFAPSQLLDLDLSHRGSLTPAEWHELVTFIIWHMPNLRRIALSAFGYIDLDFVQPVEDSTTQFSSARQSESLRQIDCRILSPAQGGFLPFNRLVESTTHLEECYLCTPINSLPCFSPHIRKLDLYLHPSPTSPVVNGELFKLVHLEVLKLTFVTAEQLQLLILFHAPSLLSLEVSYWSGSDLQSHPVPVDAISALISTSQGIHDLILRPRSPVDGMGLSLPELQSLKVTYMSHISLLASFDVPKLQLLFLEIKDGRAEDESKAGREDSAEDPIGITPSPPSFEAVGSSHELDMVNAGQILEIGEAQKRNIPEEDKKEAETSRFIDTYLQLREARSDPVMTCSPTFPVLPFEHLKDFEFKVSTASDLHPIRVFPGILTAFPALERITLPALSFNDSPYIDQLVKKISGVPTLCPNLQEIRTRDYPNEWSNLLKFLRDRKRASILSNSTIRPIHALHFPITPHGSIVEQLQDAMLGKVSTKAFPALCPRPLRIDPTLVHIASSREEDTKVGSDEETRSQIQGGARVQVQGEDMTGNGAKDRQNEEESGCGKNEDEALSCFFCDKAGLGAGCRRVSRKRGKFSPIEGSIGVVMCSRWNKDLVHVREFEVICLP